MVHSVATLASPGSLLELPWATQDLLTQSQPLYETSRWFPDTLKFEKHYLDDSKCAYIVFEDNDQN